MQTMLVWGRTYKHQQHTAHKSSNTSKTHDSTIQYEIKIYVILLLAFMCTRWLFIVWHTERERYFILDWRVHCAPRKMRAAPGVGHWTNIKVRLCDC